MAVSGIASNNNFATATNTNTKNTTDTTTNTNNTGVSDSTTQGAMNAILGKDDFLKLLLIEMQHQDPTDPMDTDKMLTQTSQLAALEMQQNTNTAMQNMVDTMITLSEVMLAGQNLSALNALGKMAVIEDNYVPMGDSAENIDITMYLPKDTKDGATFQVFDANGNVVKNIKIGKDDLKQGVNTITWDGTDDEGNFVGKGNYTVRASYTDVDGGTSTSSFGAYPIESIKFKEGIPYAVLAGKEIKFDLIAQITA
ncbi:MAG TPA: flagellar basal body rod modification protein [Campylobacter avium]|uniref:flagellar basal body rod modification protein n=1 Tax=Campylobacter avium TaxID=522485 RepID=UPI001DF646C0|nr:flagellar basal body rod modification protein [Campylobacter avium]HJE66386.1 flagellar basal body rod modification protein [Campylobacter avium]